MNTTRSNRRRFLAVLMMAPVTVMLSATPTQAQFGFGGIVYDPSNFAQNLLTATRALQQINNQIQSLQNEATMLQNMAKQLQKLDFSSLNEITQSMQTIGTLMSQAEGIGFNLTATEQALREQFPQSFDAATTTSQIVAQAKMQWQTAMSSFRQTMRVQAQVAQNVEADSSLLTRLVTQSQGAAGSLQAQQAAGQLTALAVKQQFQVQQMMAAQYRADAVERARQADALEAARTTTKRFVGSPDIYTRQ